MRVAVLVGALCVGCQSATVWRPFDGARYYGAVVYWVEDVDRLLKDVSGIRCEPGSRRSLNERTADAALASAVGGDVPLRIEETPLELKVGIAWRVDHGAMRMWITPQQHGTYNRLVLSAPDPRPITIPYGGAVIVAGKPVGRCTPAFMIRAARAPTPYTEAATLYVIEAPDDWLDDGGDWIRPDGRPGGEATRMAPEVLTTMLRSAARSRDARILEESRFVLREGALTILCVAGHELAIVAGGSQERFELEYRFAGVESSSRELRPGRALLWVVPQGNGRSHYVVLHVATVAWR